MWRQLIWKQWREQAWRIAFATVILCAVVAIGVRSRLVADQLLIGLALLGSAFVLPIFMAMGLVAPDRADGTHATLISLPIRPAISFGATLLVGLAATVIPLLAALLLFILMAAERELAYGMAAGTFFTGLYVSVILLGWTLCLTTRARSEGMVGLVGIAIVVVWTLWIGFAEMDPYARWSRWLLWPLHPFSPHMTREGASYGHMPGGYLLAIGTQLVILAGLWFVGLRDYRRTEVRS